MKIIPLTVELAKDIRENAFGDCTVVYEAMTNEEVLADIEDYLAKGRISKKTGKYLPRSLTIASLKDWLRFRLTIELHDIDPETPFDRSDEEIRKARERVKEAKNRLATSFAAYIAVLAYQVSGENK